MASDVEIGKEGYLDFRENDKHDFKEGCHCSLTKRRGSVDLDICENNLRYSLTVRSVSKARMENILHVEVSDGSTSFIRTKTRSERDAWYDAFIRLTPQGATRKPTLSRPKSAASLPSNTSTPTHRRASETATCPGSIQDMFQKDASDKQKKSGKGPPPLRRRHTEDFTAAPYINTDYSKILQEMKQMYSEFSFLQNVQDQNRASSEERRSSTEGSTTKDTKSTGSDHTDATHPTSEHSSTKSVLAGLQHALHKRFSKKNDDTKLADVMDPDQARSDNCSASYRGGGKQKSSLSLSHKIPSTKKPVPPVVRPRPKSEVKDRRPSLPPFDPDEAYEDVQIFTNDSSLKTTQSEESVYECPMVQTQSEDENDYEEIDEKVLEAIRSNSLGSDGGVQSLRPMPDERFPAKGTAPPRVLPKPKQRESNPSVIRQTPPMSHQEDIYEDAASGSLTNQPTDTDCANTTSVDDDLQEDPEIYECVDLSQTSIQKPPSPDRKDPPKAKFKPPPPVCRPKPNTSLRSSKCDVSPTFPPDLENIYDDAASISATSTNHDQTSLRGTDGANVTTTPRHNQDGPKKRTQVPPVPSQKPSVNKKPKRPPVAPKRNKQNSQAKIVQNSEQYDDGGLAVDVPASHQSSAKKPIVPPPKPKKLPIPVPQNPTQQGLSGDATNDTRDTLQVVIQKSEVLQGNLTLVERDGKIIIAQSLTETLQAGDQLLLVGSINVENEEPWFAEKCIKKASKSEVTLTIRRR